MRELIDKLERVQTAEKLFDTCFLLYEIENHHDKGLSGAMTSFNTEELMHIIHHIKPELKLKARHFLKKSELKVIEINVSPGKKEDERDYVKRISPDILKDISDPSDAVLIAAAIDKGIKKVYTRDKHHLYTTKLENHLQNYGITVYSTLNN